MTKKSLAMSKAGFSLAIFVTFFLLCAFFFTYGKTAVQEVVEKLQAEPVENGTINLSGLGPAFLLIFAGISLICFALPELLFLISFSGNFAKQGSTKGFTIVSLIGEIFGVIIMFFFTMFFLEAAGYNIVAIIVTAAFDLLVFVSFIHSIVVLAKHKNAPTA